MEAEECVRQYPPRTHRRCATAAGHQAIGASLAGVPGAADLAALEFRARLADAAAVLSAEHAARERRPMGPVERDLRRRVHPDISPVWRSLPEVSFARSPHLGDL